MAAVNLHKIDDDDDSDGWSDDSDISVEESKQNVTIVDDTELEIIPDKVQIRPQVRLLYSEGVTLQSAAN